MSGKANYTATFSDGTTETRKSNRTYTAAWIVYHDRNEAGYSAGFSGDADKAEKAATTELKKTGGRDYEVVEVVSDAEAPDEAPAGPKGTKWPDDAVVEFQVTTNPKRPGCKAAERYDLALATLDEANRATVRDLVAAGYRRDDLSWDAHRGRLAVVDVEAEAEPEGEAAASA